MNINQIAELAAQTVRDVLIAHPVEDPTVAVLDDDHFAHALAHTLLARGHRDVGCLLRIMGEDEACDLYLNATNEDHLAHGLVRFAMMLARRELLYNTGEFREEQ
jgi:DNA-binding LacI/PurR family transcriptional regulator